jgi:transitional endoplasmic reticulum ATPase
MEIYQTIKVLADALKLSPDNLLLKRQLAALMLSVGRHQEAIHHLEEIRARSKDPDTLLKLGEAYLQLARFDELIQLLEGETEEPSAELLLLRSRAYFGLGDYQLAADLYGDAIDADSAIDDPEYWDDLRGKGAKLKTKLRMVGRASVYDEPGMERPTTTFLDVGGLEEVKEKIRMNIIYPFQNPSLFQAYGKKVGGGILLYGPPGCGKTHLARATAGECQAHFINIAITDILDMYVGQSERNLHEIFELARRKAPTVIFIDEIDALGSSRQQMHHHHGRSLTNQLLTELDGMQSDNSHVLVVGATNTPWFLDAALKRPGRFDRVIFVPPPDLQARVEILRIHLKGKPVQDIDYVKVARGMERYSGADISAVCDQAAEVALQEAMRTGRMRKILTADLTQALKRVKSSTLEWLSTAKNYATFSNESGVYDDVLAYLKKG